MAENDLTAVYLRTSGIPYEWLAATARTFVAEGLAATADISRRANADSGVDVLACLHTRDRHVAAIKSIAEPVADMKAYPLECHDDYRAWVLEHTQA